MKTQPAVGNADARAPSMSSLCCPPCWAAVSYRAMSPIRQTDPTLPSSLQSRKLLLQPLFRNNGFCEVHVEFFKASLQSGERPDDDWPMMTPGVQIPAPPPTCCTCLGNSLTFSMSWLPFFSNVEIIEPSSWGGFEDWASSQVHGFRGDRGLLSDVGHRCARVHPCTHAWVHP